MLSGGSFPFHRLEQCAKWQRQVRWSGRAVRAPVPAVAAQAVEDARGEGDGVAAFLAAYARASSRADAVNEVLQFAGELVANVAVEVENLQVPAEHVVLERRGHGGGQLA